MEFSYRHFDYMFHVVEGMGTTLWHYTGVNGGQEFCGWVLWDGYNRDAHTVQTNMGTFTLKGPHHIVNDTFDEITSAEKRIFKLPA